MPVNRQETQRKRGRNVVPIRLPMPTTHLLLLEYHIPYRRGLSQIWLREITQRICLLVRRSSNRPGPARERDRRGLAVLIRRKESSMLPLTVAQYLPASRPRWLH